MKLLTLQDDAKVAKKGRWSSAPPTVREVVWVIDNPREVVDRYKQKPIDAVVEMVFMRFLGKKKRCFRFVMDLHCGFFCYQGTSTSLCYCLEFEHRRLGVIRTSHTLKRPSIL